MLNVLNKIVRPLIWVSVILYFVEVLTGSENSRDPSMLFFLWFERSVAAIFMLEHGLRTYEHFKSRDLNKYAFSFLGLVDLLAWLPFLVGFFVPTSWLGVIRTLRILRLFKLFRYNIHLQLVAVGFIRSWSMLKSLMMVMFMIALFSTALLYQLEPETFGSLFNTFWFSYTTSTTIGYGDVSPDTIPGKSVVMIVLYSLGVATFAAMVGIIGTSFNEVLTEHKEGKKPTKDFLTDVE